MVEAFYPVLTEGGVMINFSSVAAYTMPQTDEWTQAFQAWNEPDFYDQMLALAGEAEDEEGEFFRAGLAYAMSKKFVIYFTPVSYTHLLLDGLPQELGEEDRERTVGIPERAERLKYRQAAEVFLLIEHIDRKRPRALQLQ